MIQILGIRTYEVQGKKKKKEVFFEKNWRALSVQEIFANPQEVLKQIPEAEQWNLYYTVGSCLEESGRKLERQVIIPFDIDDIAEGTEEAVARAVCEALEVPWDQVGVCFSGHGVQVLVWGTTIITDKDYFEQHRLVYRAVCDKIQGHLNNLKITGHVDTSVWSAGRLMRMPETYNRKGALPPIKAKALQQKIEQIEWSLDAVSGINYLPEPEADNKFLTAVAKDKDAILAGCDFLNYMKENQADASEPLWYAMLGILAYTPDGEQLAHEYSKRHPDYSQTATNEKFQQARSAAGPRTCRNICGMWNGCENCAHWGKLASPVLIRGEEFIRTETTGFRNIRVTKTGELVQGGVNYDDLYLSFKKKFDYIVYSNSVYTWDGKRWNEMDDSEIMGYCEEKAAAPVLIRDRREFLDKIKSKSKHLRGLSFFEENARGKLHFQNGTLHLDTMRFTEHNKEYGALHVLPYGYDPSAKCPRFDKFVEEILEDYDIDLFLQYFGYCISNDECLMQRAMFLIGDGANGKSVALEVLRELVGENNHCAFTLKELVSGESIHMLHGKFFNAADEGAKRRVLASDIFKNMVTGGLITAKRKYKEKLVFRNTAKLVFASNSLPHMDDADNAIKRRMLIVTFSRRFEGADADRGLIHKLKQELPGIFNRCLHEYLKVRASGEFTISDAVAETAELHQEYGDDIGEFLWSHYEEKFDSQVARSEVYQEYCDYSAGLRQRPETRQEVFTALRRIFKQVKEVRTGGDGRRARVFRGLARIEKANRVPI